MTISELAKLCKEVNTEETLFCAKNLEAIAKDKPKTLSEAMQLILLFY